MRFDPISQAPLLELNVPEKLLPVAEQLVGEWAMPPNDIAELGKWREGFFRYIVLHGGRGSSKSWTVARLIIVAVVLGYIDRVVCAREIQKSIKDSVMKLLVDQIDLLGLTEYFIVQNDRILVRGRAGSEIIFMGFYRNVSQIKSLEGFDLVWIEEAENLTKMSMEIVDPTIRKPHSRIILTYNPQLLSDYVIKRYQQSPPDNALVIAINYLENPFCTEVTITQAEAMRLEDDGSYRHVFLGECLGESDMVIIPSAWIDSALDAHITLGLDDPTGDYMLGYDPCDQGDDYNALATMKSYLVTSLDEWRGKGTDLDVSTQRAWDELKSLGCNHFNYDVDGIGVGVTLALKDINTEGVIVGQFDAGAKVVRPDQKFHDSKLNKDTFYNLKAQRWWLLRERFMKTHVAVTTGREYPAHELISISSHISSKLRDKLKMELSSPLRMKLGGKFLVEAKKDMKRRGIASGNLADALVMATHDSTEQIREVRSYTA